jgi:hypothetical protein
MRLKVNCSNKRFLLRYIGIFHVGQGQKSAVCANKHRIAHMMNSISIFSDSTNVKTKTIMMFSGILVMFSTVERRSSEICGVLNELIAGK